MYVCIMYERTEPHLELIPRVPYSYSYISILPPDVGMQNAMITWLEALQKLPHCH